MGVIFSILFLIVFVFPVIELVFFAFKGRRILQNLGSKVFDSLIFTGLPLIYLVSFDPLKNNCCGATTAFSPEHQLTIFSLIFIFSAGFLISRNSKRVLPPLVQCLLYGLNLTGFVFNIIVAIQIKEVWVLGNLPIAVIYLHEFIRVHKTSVKSPLNSDVNGLSKIQTLFIRVLHLNLWYRIPVLLVVVAPLFLFLILILTLFGQRPDSVILAFTQTYYHRFSELDYLCNNVQCGGHYLCSVAAKGHRQIVKPIRYGERRNKKIICNRQLLISNAFEELIQEKTPWLHKIVRSKYNKVGRLIHRYYYVFNNKLVSDLVYVFMKPFEFVFLLVLYFFDTKPENRIARQYVSLGIRKKLKSV
jgi:hypothetical protein